MKKCPKCGRELKRVKGLFTLTGDNVLGSSVSYGSVYRCPECSKEAFCDG